MQNEWKIFFKDPLHTDPRGLIGNGVLINTEVILSSDLRNHGITLNPNWDVKQTSNQVWLIKQPDKDVRIFIPKTKIEKMELRFE